MLKHKKHTNKTNKQTNKQTHTYTHTNKQTAKANLRPCPMKQPIHIGFHHILQFYFYCLYLITQISCCLHFCFCLCVDILALFISIFVCFVLSLVFVACVICVEFIKFFCFCFCLIGFILIPFFLIKNIRRTWYFLTLCNQHSIITTIVTTFKTMTIIFMHTYAVLSYH